MAIKDLPESLPPEDGTDGTLTGEVFEGVFCVGDVRFVVNFCVAVDFAGIVWVISSPEPDLLSEQSGTLKAQSQDTVRLLKTRSAGHCRCRGSPWTHQK